MFAQEFAETTMPFDATPCQYLPVDSDCGLRLGQLLRVLDDVPDDEFDLNDWIRGGVCSTVACAVGWAMRDDWFRAQGLERHGAAPYYAGERGWRAVRKFFDLSEDEASYLFHAGHYADPSRATVTERIRAFARGR